MSDAGILLWSMGGIGACCAKAGTVKANAADAIIIIFIVISLIAKCLMNVAIPIFLNGALDWITWELVGLFPRNLPGRRDSP